MKTRTLGFLTALSMALVGGAVYAVTPNGGFSATPDPSVAEAAPTDETAEDAALLGAAGAATLGQFTAGKTVTVDGRVGQSKLLGASTQENLLLLELKGSSESGGEQPRVNLSIVIDKSGSMRGTRLTNALAAAETAVQRLRDGDTVSVIAFDTKIETVVPTTAINTSSRGSALQAIRGISLGGDTCISCGLEEGLSELRRADSFGAGGTGAVDRMILLSDGEPTSGVRDVSSFRAIAQRAMTQGVSVTTIGVDVDFNETIMTAIALASNGRHHFVENDRDLARVFEAEAAALEESVAADSVAEIELAPGVELVQVFDRTFTRSGNRITVPLGTFTKGETKTVLVKVRAPAGADGAADLAKVDVAYRDLVSGKDEKHSGSLGFERVSSSTDVAELDGLVLDRLQRSETAAALRDANSLFVVGKADEARRRLQQAQQSLNKAKTVAPKLAPAGRAKDVERSFAAQEAELNRAENGFATPPPDPFAAPGAPQPAPAPAREQRVNQKKNAEVANDLAF